jgi:hypothetical protein
VLSDRFGARAVMYWTFGFSLILLFMLSYPPTEYVIRGIDGPIRFSTEMGCALRDHGVRAGLLHEPRQGGGLQAHPGLLPRTMSARSAASSA